MDTLFWIIIVFAAITIALLFYVIWRMGRRGMSEKDRAYIGEQWARVRQAQSATPKQAILDADKLLDYALGKMRYSGNLGEKLKKAEPLFRDINGTWAAHKMRNRLAHELDYHPSEQQIGFALTQFERALKDLRAL